MKLLRGGIFSGSNLYAGLFRWNAATMECGIVSSAQNLTGDIFLRTAGLGFISIAIFAARYLYALVHMAPVHQASPAEFTIAAVAFLGASAGLTLIALGRHIFDQVQISARWASRPQGVRGPSARRFP